MLNTIATMPNDGTFVLVTDGIRWCDANKFPGFKIGRWEYIDGVCRGGILDFVPSFWMPLPKNERN